MLAGDARAAWLRPHGVATCRHRINHDRGLIVQRTLLTVGLLIVIVGVLWPWIAKLGLGRLPGDLMIDKPGFKLFAPFTTMIVVSVILSLIVWLFRR
jgi:hypothetical protein